jgi:hypothetical protein
MGVTFVAFVIFTYCNLRVTRFRQPIRQFGQEICLFIAGQDSKSGDQNKLRGRRLRMTFVTAA